MVPAGLPKLDEPPSAELSLLPELLEASLHATAIKATYAQDRINAGKRCAAARAGVLFVIFAILRSFRSRRSCPRIESLEAMVIVGEPAKLLRSDEVGPAPFGAADPLGSESVPGF
jgi:hypothetical protein